MHQHEINAHLQNCGPTNNNPSFIMASCWPNTFHREYHFLSCRNETLFAITSIYPIIYFEQFFLRCPNCPYLSKIRINFFPKFLNNTDWTKIILTWTYEQDKIDSPIKLFYAYLTLVKSFLRSNVLVCHKPSWLTFDIWDWRWCQ